MSLPISALARFVWVYELAPTITGTLVQTPEGLTAEQRGFGAAPICAQSEPEFFVKAMHIQVTFERDAAGAITGLVLHRAGTRTPAKKIN